jgi:hypothetical protein
MMKFRIPINLLLSTDDDGQRHEKIATWWPIQNIRSPRRP